MVAMLILSAHAVAEHHRGHALGFLAKVELHNGLMRTRLNSYVASAEVSCTLSPDDYSSIEVLQRYSGFVDSNMQAVRTILENGGDLDEARRLVTRPNGDPPNAADVLVEGLMHRSRQLVNSCPDANVWLAQVQQRITLMWSNVDRVNWHIQDAIREEVYVDSAFICAGPENHCD